MSNPTPPEPSQAENDAAAIDAARRAMQTVGAMALEVSRRSHESYDEAFVRIKASPLADGIIADAIAHPHGNPAAAAALFLSAEMAWPPPNRPEQS